MKWKSAVTAIIMLLFFTSGAQADFMDDFSGGLGGWTTEGGVIPTDETAALSDMLFPYSGLYQGVALTPGQYVLEFDIGNLMIGGVPGGWPDTFFASLYFTDDMSTFDLLPGGFDDVDPLLSMEPDSFFDVFVELTPSGIGADWYHASYVFDNAYNYAVPTFELFNFDQFPANGLVFIDNVSITQIPEPASLVLLGCGLAGFAIRRRRRL